MVWSEDIDHAAIVRINQWSLEQSEMFWDETWDATSKRVSEYLEEADTWDGSDEDFFQDAMGDVADS